MRVSELRIGELYQIRSDRATTVTIAKDGILDIHLGHGHFKGKTKIRPFDHLIYLGKDRNNTRWVNYRGKKMRVYPNIWRHVRHID